MKYFTLKELVQSDTAELQRIDNTPTWAAVDNLKALVETPTPYIYMTDKWTASTLILSTLILLWFASAVLWDAEERVRRKLRKRKR